MLIKKLLFLLKYLYSYDGLLSNHIHIMRSREESERKEK